MFSNQTNRLRAQSGNSRDIRGRAPAARFAPASRLRDKLLLIALILLAFGLRRPDGLDVTDAWLPADAVWLVALLVACIGVVSERKTALRLVRSSLPLGLMLLLVGLSMFWSGEPETTARRSIALLGTTLIALHFVSRLGLKRFVESLAVALAVAAVASIVLIAFFPGYGLEHGGVYDGAWLGCFVEKNQLGQAMALGIITLATLIDGTRGAQRLRLTACLCLFLVLLAGSRSAGAIASTAIFALAFPVWLWIRSTRSRALASRGALVIVATICVVWSTGLVNDGLSLLGRDASFTGRTNVWQASLNAISERPALGYGYREFWNQNGDARYFVTPNEDGWVADTAHNGFVEVALDLGLIGEAALVLFLAVAAARAAASFWQGQDLLSAWPIFAMVDIVLENLSDRSFVTQDSIFWIVFLAAFWFATEARLEGRAGNTRAA